MLLDSIKFLSFLFLIVMVKISCANLNEFNQMSFKRPEKMEKTLAKSKIQNFLNDIIKGRLEKNLTNLENITEKELMKNLWTSEKNLCILEKRNNVINLIKNILNKEEVDEKRKKTLCKEIEALENKNETSEKYEKTQEILKEKYKSKNEIFLADQIQILEEEIKMLSEKRSEDEIINNIKIQFLSIKEYIINRKVFNTIFDEFFLCNYKMIEYRMINLNCIAKLNASFEKDLEKKIEIFVAKIFNLLTNIKKYNINYGNITNKNHKKYNYLDTYLYIGILVELNDSNEIKNYPLIHVLMNNFLTYLRENKQNFIDLKKYGDYDGYDCKLYQKYN